MFAQMGQLLVDSVFVFFVYLLLARFYMQWARAPFRNPAGEFVIALTNWMVLPARRVVPGLFGVDLSSLVLAWLGEALRWVLVLWLKGISLAGAPGIASAVIAALAAVSLARISLYLLIGVVILQAVLSWFNPRTPLAPVLEALTRPFYKVLRRFIPPVGNIDLTPLVVLLAAQLALIPVSALGAALARIF